MGLSAHVGSFAQSGSTGNQSVTGVGFQPKIVIFFGNHRTSDGSSPDLHHFFGVGVSSSQRLGMGNHSIDAEAINGGNPTRVYRSLSTTRCIVVIEDSTTLAAQANFVSQDSDGFTVDWTVTDGVARVVNFLALGGTDLTNVNASTFAAATATGNQAVTGVGFQPDCVLFFAPSMNTAEGTSLASSLGFKGWAVSPSQRGVTSWRMINGLTTNSSTSSRQLTNQCITVPTVLREADFVSFDSDGFTINWSVVNGTASILGYIALKGMLVAAGSFNQPTSTGNQSITSPGFTPSTVLLMGMNKVSSSSDSTNAPHSFGVGVSSAQRACNWFFDDNGEDPTISDSDLDRTKVLKHLTAGTPTLNAAADFVSQDVNGFTLDWPTVDGTAREILYLALGAQGIFPPWHAQSRVAQNTLIRM